MSRIQEHTFRLAHHICTRLQRLRHSCAPSLAWHSDKWTGEMCEVYGWGEGEGVQISSATQGTYSFRIWCKLKNTSSAYQFSLGSIVSFNIIDALGCYVPFSDVGRLAEGSNITLRTGGSHNLIKSYPMRSRVHFILTSRLLLQCRGLSGVSRNFLRGSCV